MTMNTQKQLDASARARALSRWEGEGGALAPMPDQDSIDDVSLRLLARLGAALLEAWDDLPRPLQGRVVSRSRTIGAADHARVMENLARFLERHDAPAS